MPLREVMPDDLEFFFEHQRDPAAARMAGFTARDRAAFFEHWTRRVLPDHVGLKQTIVVGDAVAGHVVSWVADDLRLVGYWIDRAYWGRGVATAALREFLVRERARPLHAWVAAHNGASVRVLQRCAFRRVTMAGDASADGVEEHLYRLDG